jgi:hypothetical protein
VKACLVGVLLLSAQLFAVDTDRIAIPALDSLLLSGNFEQLDHALAGGEFDQNLLVKYSNLSKAIKRLQIHSDADLAAISEAGRQYEPIYTPEQAGSPAAQAYAAYQRHHEAGEYLFAVRSLRLSAFHKSTYLQILSKDVLGKLDKAQDLMDSGAHEAAYDLLKSIEAPIFSLETFEPVRQLYDMRLSQCRFVKEKRANTQFLMDTQYHTSHKHELNLFSGMRVAGQAQSFEKLRDDPYSVSTSLGGPTLITDIHMTSSFVSGMTYSRKLVRSAWIDLTYGTGLSEYFGNNSQTGLTTQFKTQDHVLGLGLRHLFQQTGRIRYWTGLQYRDRKSQVIDQAYEDLDDHQLELELGFSLYLRSRIPLVIQPRVALSQSLGTAEHAGRSQVYVHLAAGLYF